MIEQEHIMDSHIMAFLKAWNPCSNFLCNRCVTIIVSRPIIGTEKSICDAFSASETSAKNRKGP